MANHLRLQRSLTPNNDNSNAHFPDLFKTVTSARLKELGLLGSYSPHGVQNSDYVLVPLDVGELIVTCRCPRDHALGRTPPLMQQRGSEIAEVREQPAVDGPFSRGLVAVCGRTAYKKRVTRTHRLQRGDSR